MYFIHSFSYRWDAVKKLKCFGFCKNRSFFNSTFSFLLVYLCDVNITFRKNCSLSLLREISILVQYRIQTFSFGRGDTKKRISQSICMHIIESNSLRGYKCIRYGTSGTKYGDCRLN